MLQQSIHRWLWAICLVAIIGCSGESESQDDNTSDSTQETSPETNPGDNTSPGDETQTPDDTNPDTSDPNAPAEPTPPAEPDFHTWLPERCELGSRPDIPSMACVSVGTACDPDNWPTIPDGITNIRYVTPVGTGDGLTPQSPMGSIQSAINQLNGGGAVLLSTGTFEEPIVISGGVQVVGICPRFTQIISTTATVDFGTVEITGSGDNGIRDVTISGPRPGIWVWDLTGTAHVQGTIIDDAEYVAFSFSGESNHIQVEDVVIQDSKPSATDGYGWGMELFGTASLELRNVAFESSTDVSLYASGAGVNISAENLVVARTQPDATTMSGGWGIGLFEGASLLLTQGYLYDNRGLAMVAQEEGTSLDAHDVVIAKTSEDGSDQTWGQGLNIRLGAQAIIGQAYITDSLETAISIMDPGTTATLTDITVANTRAQVADGDAGWGLWLYDGPVVELERARFTNNRDVGVLLDLPGTILNATDLIVEGTREHTTGIAGWGMGIQSGSQANLTRARIQDNREVGIVLFNDDTQLIAEDLWVEGTGGVDCVDDPDAPCEQGYGDGIEVLGGSYMELDRFKISGNSRVGLVIFDPTGRDTGPDWSAEGIPSIQLSNGLVTENLIGVNIQGETISLEDDFTNVLNYDNLEIDLTTDNLSLPGPADALESALE